MYTLNSEQLSSVEGWIKSLPDSMVKSNYEKWLSELKPKDNVTSEQLEKFLSYSNALPKGFQDYPQEFAIAIKSKSTPTSYAGSNEPEKKASKKSASKAEATQPEKVREGAKLNPEKEETKPVKPTVVVVNKK